jgi:hypothetical protein
MLNESTPKKRASNRNDNDVISNTYRGSPLLKAQRAKNLEPYAKHL